MKKEIKGSEYADPLNGLRDYSGYYDLVKEAKSCLKQYWEKLIATKTNDKIITIYQTATNSLKQVYIDEFGDIYLLYCLVEDIISLKLDGNIFIKNFYGIDTDLDLSNYWTKWSRLVEEQSLMEEKQNAIQEIKDYWKETDLGSEEQLDRSLGKDWIKEIKNQANSENIQQRINYYRGIINTIKEIVKIKEQPIADLTKEKAQLTAEKEKYQKQLDQEQQAHQLTKKSLDKEKQEHQQTKKTLSLGNKEFEDLEKDWAKKAYNSWFAAPLYQQVLPRIFPINIRRKYKEEKKKKVEDILLSLTITEKQQAESLVKAAMISCSLEIALHDSYWEKKNKEEIKERQNNVEYTINLLEDKIKWDDIKEQVKNHPLYLQRLDNLDKMAKEVQKKMEFYQTVAQTVAPSIK